LQHAYSQRKKCSWRSKTRMKSALKRTFTKTGKKMKVPKLR
jgi:hypothetical protein